jgi:hypothetical protein
LVDKRVPIDTELIRHTAFAPDVLRRTRMFITRDEDGRLLYSAKVVEQGDGRLPIVSELEALREELEGLRAVTEKNGDAEGDLASLELQLQNVERDLKLVERLVGEAYASGHEKVVEFGAAWASDAAKGFNGTVGQLLQQPVMNLLNRELASKVSFLLTGSDARVKLYLGQAQIADQVRIARFQSDPQRVIVVGDLEKGSHGSFIPVTRRDIDFTPRTLTAAGGGQASRPVVH